MAREKRNRPLRTNVAIVGDGQTERIYFDNIRDMDRPRDLHIFPDYPRNIGNYTGVLEKAVELKENYEIVYALIDMDQVFRNRQESEYKVDKKKAEDLGIIVLENNPCFEIWLLLHFLKTGRAFLRCDEVERELQKYIPNYSKSLRFLRGANLYNKDLITAHAIPNAKFLERGRNQQDNNYPRAEIFKFFSWYLQRNNTV
jgi:hypothetical protein